MTREQRENIFVQVLSYLAFIAVFAGTISIYFYSNGWRFDFFKQKIVKTGVLTVESSPANGTLYIEGEAKGRTPKSLSLDIGTYNISVEKEGYKTWNKKVHIKEEKSTPTFPWLLKEQFTTNNVFTLEDEKYLNSWTNETEDHIYILTEVQDTDKTYTYTIYQYDINRPFWDLSVNPKETFKHSSDTKTTFDLNLSPSGRFAIFSTATQEKTNQYIWEINRANNLANMTKVDLTAFSDHKKAWSNDNDYILFETDEELISFNIEKQTKYLLKKKDPNTHYIWTTDQQGYFYAMEETNNETYPEQFTYTLKQSLLDGSNPSTIIKDTYFRKDAGYIIPYREGEKINIPVPYKNSPECTKSVGEIEEMFVNRIAEGIYISTTESSYWYDINTDMFTLISPNQTDFINFSNDNKKILISDSTGYAIFTFEKDTGDHTVQLGTKYIPNLENTSDLKWLSNSTNLTYTKDNTLYITDKDGDNTTELITTLQFKYTGLNYGKDQIYTVEIKDEKIIINRIVIH